MRLIPAASVLILAAALVACAGGEPAASGNAGSSGGSAAASPAPAPATQPSPAANPTPADEAAVPATVPTPADAGASVALPYPSDLAAHAGLRIDCQQDSECAVKDVGNCCGRYDACVRADSQPDPTAVQAECATTGMAGICGFPVIEACVCAAGTCQAAPDEGADPDHAVR
jgi:hypothetical protein